ncbi:hypothetical protein EGH21_01250 [Halomicroarcula sp. F13]|uniref:Uncharacterized protein n=2 Tax=Haloarcula TaxID=2237 RepID=A0A830GH68_9EURY|nr:MULTISPECIES: hypothetical protein [Halomicroarcula]MBX0321646.1 hypothetical protein [Halomicroarcula rubra]MBX0346961.1 hypothetical protein [Halomicroarcula pellucida]MDS0277164.1 hypothetical protein [Halomicroarcula sp. S1AR25-4]GGN86290.1 hypothetical protein GCM10009030_03820 [Halomicroarcula pellucida]
MTRPLMDAVRRRQFRTALFVAAAVVVVLTAAGWLGYGNFATTLPGLALLVVAGYLGFRASRSLS